MSKKPSYSPSSPPFCIKSAKLTGVIAIVNNKHVSKPYGHMQSLYLPTILANSYSNSLLSLFVFLAPMNSLEIQSFAQRMGTVDFNLKDTKIKLNIRLFDRLESFIYLEKENHYQRGKSYCIFISITTKKENERINRFLFLRP